MPNPLKHHKYFQGPNIHFPMKGLLLSLENTSEDKNGRIIRELSHQEIESYIAMINRAFPVIRESQELKQECFSNNNPLFKLLLKIQLVEILIRDFTVNSHKGVVLQEEREQCIIFIPCDDENTGLHAWSLASEAVDIMSGFSALDQERLLSSLKYQYQKIRKTLCIIGPNQTTIALARAANRKGIPYYRMGLPNRFLQLGQGMHLKKTMETATDLTSTVSRIISGDKYLTNILLHRHGIPTPSTQVLTSAEGAVAIASQLGFPLVVKPKSSGKGKGVSIDIRNNIELERAIESAAKHQCGVVIERYIEGDDHRILIVGGRYIATAKRIPAMICGDGYKTARQLIEGVNDDPRRGMPFERILEKIDIDDETLHELARHNLTLDAVIAKGKVIPLRRTANISRGGTSVDVTNAIHQDNKLMLERVARLIGLDVIGIDFITPDISKSWREIPCAILEVNSTPGLRPHLSANPDRDVVGPIIDHLFPVGSDGRIPVVGITGSIGKTTTSQMTAHILAEAGKQVALSTTQGAWIGQELVRQGDTAGGAMGKALLQDPGVEAGVFELSRGGLIKNGLVLDDIDVGVILNVHENHLGLDGINSREDLAKVKSLVVRHAKKVAVLNADDPLCMNMRNTLTARKICLVSTNASNPLLIQHKNTGGMVAYIDSACLMLYEKSNLIGQIPVEDIPATWAGKFHPAIENALFALAITHGLEIDFGLIAGALKSFQSTSETNPGRANFIEGFPFSIFVSWADGAIAMKETAIFLKGLDVKGKRRLLFCAAGNRSDAFIRNMGKSAAHQFDEYICSDWEDLRGRAPGEAAGLLKEGLIQEGVNEDTIKTIHSHDEALDFILSTTAPDDLIALITYSSARVANALSKYVRNA